MKKIGISRKTLRRWLKPAWLYFLSKSLQPISHRYGLERGQAIDRYYIEYFLRLHQNSITDRCLEVRDNRYTKLYGQHVIHSDVIDIDRNNKNATLYNDLRDMSTIPDASYTCVILTQVLQFIDDVPAVIRECYRILKNGGTLLVTVPAMSRIDVRATVVGDFWRFTQASARYLFEKYFAADMILITSHGNVRSGLAFWIGLAQEDIDHKALDYNDPDFPVIISIKATKHENPTSYITALSPSQADISLEQTHKA